MRTCRIPDNNLIVNFNQRTGKPILSGKLVTKKTFALHRTSLHSCLYIALKICTTAEDTMKHQHVRFTLQLHYGTSFQFPIIHVVISLSKKVSMQLQCAFIEVNYYNLFNTK